VKHTTIFYKKLTNVAVDTKQYPTGQNNPVINMHLSLFLHFSEDFGRTFKNITSLLSKDEPIFIRKHAAFYTPLIVPPQGGPTLSLPMDHPYQVWFNLVEQFYRKRLTCENLMDDRQQMPSNGKGSH
jgi:hypothetical protein